MKYTISTYDMKNGVVEEVFQTWRRPQVMIELSRRLSYLEADITEGHPCSHVVRIRIEDDGDDRRGIDDD